MAIQLKPEQEKRITNALRSGAYSNPHEVIDQALEMLQDRDEWLTEQRTEIANKIEAGYASAQKGDLIDED
ncbi:MAG: type II toxin-antitoxin system ParD family antitoxin [Acidobacteriota bacterium]